MASTSLVKFLSNRKHQKDISLKKLHVSNKSLTNDEEMFIVHTAKIMAGLGMGLEKSSCLKMINTVIKSRVEDKDFIPVTMTVLDNLLKKNSTILGLISGNTIDPARVRQADENVRDTEFIKLENYISLLFAMNKVPWCIYAEIPKENLYNIDEVATNCYNHRRKIIYRASRLGRAFEMTPGGDGHMPYHITPCLMSCANGEKKTLYLLLCFFLIQN